MTDNEAAASNDTDEGFDRDATISFSLEIHLRCRGWGTINLNDDLDKDFVIDMDDAADVVMFDAFGTVNEVINDLIEENASLRATLNETPDLHVIVQPKQVDT